jgi:hypothetical protein
VLEIVLFDSLGRLDRAPFRSRVESEQKYETADEIVGSPGRAALSPTAAAR